MRTTHACEICRKVVFEVCGDGACRPCHKSLDFDECVSGLWNAKQLLANGRPLDEVREMFPEAGL